MTHCKKPSVLPSKNYLKEINLRPEETKRSYLSHIFELPFVVEKAELDEFFGDPLMSDRFSWGGVAFLGIWCPNVDSSWIWHMNLTGIGDQLLNCQNLRIWEGLKFDLLILECICNSTLLARCLNCSWQLKRHKGKRRMCPQRPKAKVVDSFSMWCMSCVSCMSNWGASGWCWMERSSLQKWVGKGWCCNGWGKGGVAAMCFNMLSTNIFPTQEVVVMDHSCAFFQPGTWERVLLEPSINRRFVGCVAQMQHGPDWTLISGVADGILPQQMFCCECTQTAEV